MKAPRIMIAGTHSGVGKTTIATAVMGLLNRKGFQVNPFKVGPDYIDPSYHAVAAGRPCRNLDCWMLKSSTVYELFCKAADNGGISVIEGVMGLYDGASGISDEGSSAQVAKLTKTPVILIVDVRSMARSAAAVVLGFQQLDPELNIAGILLNRIGSDRHLGLVTEAIEKYCGLPVVGYIRKNSMLELPSRHLGLIPAGEGGDLPQRINALSENIEEGVSVEKLLAIANTAPPLKSPGENLIYNLPAVGRKVRIGLARDEAFSFYYQDGLEILEHLGTQLIPFSPLHQQHLPSHLDGIYIGGGYPEIYLEELSANASMRQEIKEFALANRPVFGECGGLMYLSQGIKSREGSFYPMVGIVPGISVMKPKLVSLGYVSGECAGDNLLGAEGDTFRGHEFHYSAMEENKPDENPAFDITRNRSRERLLSGYAKGNILASYIHIHFGTNPNLAKNLVERCYLAGRR